MGTGYRNPSPLTPVTEQPASQPFGKAGIVMGSPWPAHGNATPRRGHEAASLQEQLCCLVKPFMLRVGLQSPENRSQRNSVFPITHCVFLDCGLMTVSYGRWKLFHNLTHAPRKGIGWKVVILSSLHSVWRCSLGAVSKANDRTPRKGGDRKWTCLNMYKSPRPFPTLRRLGNRRLGTCFLSFFFPDQASTEYIGKKSSNLGYQNICI